MNMIFDFKRLELVHGLLWMFSDTKGHKFLLHRYYIENGLNSYYIENGPKQLLALYVYINHLRFKEIRATSRFTMDIFRQ